MKIKNIKGGIMKITESALRKEIRKIIKEYTSQAPQVLSQSAITMLGIYVVGLMANSLITIADYSNAIISAEDSIKMFSENEKVKLSLEGNKFVFTSTDDRIEVNIEKLSREDKFDFAVSIYQAVNNVDNQTAFKKISRGDFSGEQAPLYHYLLETDALSSNNMTMPLTNESLQTIKLKRIIKRIILQDRIV